MNVATPTGDWKDGERMLWLYLLLKQKILRLEFLKGFTEIKPYPRMTPQPNK
jgi:hypothetical protein